jgi:transposase-like protein
MHSLIVIVQSQPKRRRSQSAQQLRQRATHQAKGTRVGRPLTYSPDLCEKAIALGLKGKHWAAIARAFCISRNTLYQWTSEYPEFKDAMDRARAASQAWWEDKIQQKLGAKHFQAQAARTILAGQFKEDYSEQRGTDVKLTIDLDAAIREAASRRRALPGDTAKPVGTQFLVPSTEDITPSKR